jgi:hypothetical protein
VRRRGARGAVAALVLVGAAVALGLTQGWIAGPVPARIPAPGAALASASTTRSDIRALFDARRSGIEVHGTGTVSRILPDDTAGSRHERFILALPDGLTILVAHDIDIAPRLNGLRVGDAVAFLGQYEWNAEGGTVHWTHHDPSGRHETGWLEWNDRTYG